MVLLIAGPPVEVGVTMYVLSISSVSEVLMVQFAFSNSYRTHIDSRSFISFWPFPFVRACTDACTPFSFTLFMENSTIHRESDRGELNRRTYDTIHRSFLHANDQSGSIDRIDTTRYQTRRPNEPAFRARRSSNYAACFRLFVSRLSDPHVCTCVQTFWRKYQYARVPREIQRKNNTGQRETD